MILGMAKVRTGLLAPGVSGRVGGVVFAQTPQGTVLRERPVRRSKPTGAMQTSMRRMTRVAAVFRTLSAEQAQAWRNYARTLNPAQAESAVNQGPSGQQLFNAYGLKLLQIDASAEIPVTPPSGPFFGDGVGVSASAVPGGLSFVANAANRPGVLTELLVQRLPSVQCRTYLSRYRTAGFVGFSSAGEGTFVAASRGAWAVGVRFVEAGTGRMMGVIEIGVVEVG